MKGIYGRIVVSLTFFMMSILMLAFFSPIVFVHADEMTVEVSANVSAIGSLALNTNNLKFSIVPTNEGAFASKSLISTVSTNSSLGYDLYLSSVDSSTNMTHVDPNVSDVIASNFSGAVTGETMPVNSWGYSLNNTNFLKIPTSSSQALLKSVDHFPTNEELTNTVNFGVKVSSLLSAGSYTKDVVFTLIVHDDENYGLHSISDMQDMTSAVCAATTTPTKNATGFDWSGARHGDSNYVPRKKLRDSRDGKYYLVSKLADGNCWMSQNLAFTFTANVPFEASNNDGTTKTVTPTRSTQTGTKVGWGASGWHSYFPNSTVVYYQNGLTKANAPTASGDTYLWENGGAYYNWYAATVGATSGNSTSSICPKGWRLPLTSGSKSFAGLINTAYGIKTAGKSASETIRSDPLNFVLSGDYKFDGSIVNQSSKGYWWGSATKSGNNAYDFVFEDTSLKTDDASNKSYGLAVRCVAI